MPRRSDHAHHATRPDAVSGFPTSRRRFVAQSLGAAAGIASFTFSPPAARGGVFPGGSDAIRVGVIGCGGRGTGAALQAAAADPGVRVVALGDMLVDHIDSSAGILAASLGSRFDCPDRRRFVGADAFAAVLDAGVDLVVLAAPPSTRPHHVAAAIQAGAHIHCEAPAAIDVAGVHEVANACAQARAAGLAFSSGLSFRHDAATREVVARIRAGSIGTPRSARVEALLGLPWRRPEQPGDDRAEARIRNWVSHQDLSGGHFVEHLVHAIDKAVWAIGDDHPVSATGIRLPDQRGPLPNAEGHAGTAVRYTFADGRTLDAICHRRAAGHHRVEETVVGTAGTAQLRIASLPAGPNRFQTGMDALLRTLRSGGSVDEGSPLCRSTLMAIMGRMAAESGRCVTWGELLAAAPTPSSLQSLRV